MKVLEVKGRMLAKGIGPAEMARKMNMDLSTYYRKMKKGGDTFTLGNLQVMKETLALSNEEAVEILILH